MIKKVANGLLTVLVALPGLLFVVMGLRWLVDPSAGATQLGLTIETGLGLSSQVGDLSAFFLTTGLCMLMALVTGRRSWYYPPMMLLGIAATGRILAWLLHDAAFAGTMIVFEVVVAMLLLTASRVLADKA